MVVSLNSVTRGELFGRRNILHDWLLSQLEREVTQNYQNLGWSHRSNHRAEHRNFNQRAVLRRKPALPDRKTFAPDRNAGDFRATSFRRRILTVPLWEINRTHKISGGWNPKTGLIYEVDRETQLFMNFSGSWQPPSFDNMVDFTEGPHSSRGLHAVAAATRRGRSKLGTRGEHGRFQWELSLYHSWLRNELLELNDAQGNDLGDVNVNRSYHQGIEASLDIELLRSVSSRKKKKGLEAVIDVKSNLHAQRFPFRWRSRLTATTASREFRFIFMKRELLYETAIRLLRGTKSAVQFYSLSG